jgi:hypothetical protein
MGMEDEENKAERNEVRKQKVEYVGKEAEMN